jgi:hypothetical protein
MHETRVALALGLGVRTEALDAVLAGSVLPETCADSERVHGAHPAPPDAARKVNVSAA